MNIQNERTKVRHLRSFSTARIEVGQIISKHDGSICLPLTESQIVVSASN